MRVESIHGADGVVNVRCTGTVGIGSESWASMFTVSEALSRWKREHPDPPVREIVVDFTDVDYRGGDGPVSCFMPFIRQGVGRIRYLAGPASAAALEELVAAVNLPWFSVERADA